MGFIVSCGVSPALRSVPLKSTLNSKGLSLSATSVSFSVKDLQTVQKSDLATRSGDLTDYDVKREATVVVKLLVNRGPSKQ